VAAHHLSERPAQSTSSSSGDWFNGQSASSYSTASTNSGGDARSSYSTDNKSYTSEQRSWQRAQNGDGNSKEQQQSDSTYRRTDRSDNGSTQNSRAETITASSGRTTNNQFTSRDGVIDGKTKSYSDSNANLVVQQTYKSGATNNQYSQTRDRDYASDTQTNSGKNWSTTTNTVNVDRALPDLG
jgi:hypothetical protein